MKSKALIGLLLVVIFIGGFVLGSINFDVINSKKMDYDQLAAETDILYRDLYEIQTSTQDAVDYNNVALDMEMYYLNYEEYEKYKSECEAGNTDSCLVEDMYAENIESSIVTISAKEMTEALTNAKSEVEAVIEPFSKLTVQKDLETLYGLILDSTTAIIAYIDDAITSLETYGDLDSTEYEAYVADISDTKELVKEASSAVYDEATRSSANV